MSLLTNSFTVILHLRSNTLNNGKLQVYARITINKKRIEMSVKHAIDLKYWNEKTGLPKAVTEELIQLNRYLEQLKSTYFASYREMILQKKEISTESFRKLYYGIEDDEYTLSKLMNYHNDVRDAPVLYPIV